MIDQVKARTGWSAMDEIKIQGDQRSRLCTAFSGNSAYKFAGGNSNLRSKPFPNILIYPVGNGGGRPIATVHLAAFTATLNKDDMSSVVIVPI
jgi:hypothetical protein